MERSTCVLITHSSTNNELQDYQQILPSDEFYWNPPNNLFETYSLDEDNITSSNIHWYTKLVESIIYCTPTTIQCRENSGLHKFDRAVENSILWLKQGSGTPDHYLGDNVEKVSIKGWMCCLVHQLFFYLKSAIDNVNHSLGVYKAAINNYGDGHRNYSSSYRPELDATEEMG